MESCTWPFIQVLANYDEEHKFTCDTSTIYTEQLHSYNWYWETNSTITDLSRVNSLVCHARVDILSNGCVPHRLEIMVASTGFTEIYVPEKAGHFLTSKPWLMYCQWMHNLTLAFQTWPYFKKNKMCNPLATKIWGDFLYPKQPTFSAEVWLQNFSTLLEWKTMRRNNPVFWCSKGYSLFADTSPFRM